MKRSFCTLALLTVLGFAQGTTPARAADDDLDFGSEPAVMESDDPYAYRGAPARREQPSIAQQKAQLRAEQRMARMAALKWYGFSAARPVASGMPFTTMYSHGWQNPGGRPFAWTAGSRSVIIYHNQSPVYR